MPNIIGCIDGTLITIRKFDRNKIGDYISRRHKPEINVMVRLALIYRYHPSMNLVYHMLYCVCLCLSCFSWYADQTIW